jgi:hypothetical protein
VVLINSLFSAAALARDKFQTAYKAFVNNRVSFCHNTGAGVENDPMITGQKATLSGFKCNCYNVRTAFPPHVYISKKLDFILNLFATVLHISLSDSMLKLQGYSLWQYPIALDQFCITYSTCMFSLSIISGHAASFPSHYYSTACNILHIFYSNRLLFALTPTIHLHSLSYHF